MKTLSSARADIDAAEPPLVRESRGAIAILTLNRPRTRNTLTEAMLAALGDELTAIAKDRSVRAVVLMGGIIHVESTHGTGTTFRIRVPIATCESPLPAPPALPPASRLVLVSRSSSMQQAIAAIGRRLQVETMVIEDHRRLAALSPLGDHDAINRTFRARGWANLFVNRLMKRE